jgi:16S rRNA (uracil1498-N3)-methyltransferase
VGSAAHAIVVSVEAPELDDVDRHHLERVLRLRSGEIVTVTDGRGSWRTCRFGPGGALEVEGEVRLVTPHVQTVHVAFAVPKGDRPELIVQKLTEIGADRITPMSTARTVRKWEGERGAKHDARLARVVREAVMQSRRVRVPQLDPISSFDEVAGLFGAVLAAPGGGRLTAGSGPILVGPEGGWAEEELLRPLSRVSLGEHVLRSETAALVACALAVSARAALVGE